MPPEFWTSLLVNAGVAAVILAVMFAGIYRLASWIGKRIDDWVVPLVSKHIAFVTMLESQLIHMQQQNAAQTEAMAVQAEAMEKIIERLEQLARNN